MIDNDARIESLLTPREASPDRAWMDAVFARTLAELRRQRRRRRVASLLSLTACAAVVGALAGLVELPAVPEPPRAPERRVVREEPPRAPVALEWQALEGKGDSAVLYRRAADGYLDDGDPDNAVRCYGHALDSGDDLELTEKDSWLLLAIKQARKMESSR